MAIAKSAVTVLASGSCAAGSTRASPGQTGAAIDCSTYVGGEIIGSITNGTAPGVAGSIEYQESADGSTGWAFYDQIFGDTTASSVTALAVPLRIGVKYLRAITYGNTTNAVTCAVSLVGVTL